MRSHHDLLSSPWIGSCNGSGRREREDEDDGEWLSDEGPAPLIGRFIEAGVARDLELDEPFEEADIGISPDTGVFSREADLDCNRDLFADDGWTR